VRIHAVVPDWLVADDEIERPVVGGVLHGDFEVWDASWTYEPVAGCSVRLMGHDPEGRPESELVGIARLLPDRELYGFFVDTGEVCAYVYTGPYEADDGPISARPQPIDGEHVAVRGTLGFAPEYVAEGTFVPLRALDGRPDADTFVPTWSVIVVEQHPIGSWHVEIEATGA
jgi:hypothetical protein